MSEPRMIFHATHSQALLDLQDQIRQRSEAGAVEPLTFILPTRGVIEDLQRQLGNSMGVDFYQFYGLGQDILRRAGRAAYEINDTAVRRLIRMVLKDMHQAENLTTFAPVHEKRGFVEVLLKWIREMKTQGITPEQYLAYAEESKRERDRQLGDVYARYQTYLRDNDYADTDGFLWLAAEALRMDPALYRGRGRFCLYGFDQLTPIQIQILTHLADRAEAFVVYLLWDVHREPGSLALARLRETRAALEKALSWDVQVLPDPRLDKNIPYALTRSIFEKDPEKIQANDHIQMVEAPSREEEAAWALRACKRLLLAGVPAREIALLTPKPQRYASLVSTLADEYSLPVDVTRDLEKDPLISLLVKVLKLSPDYPWSGVLDVLRSRSLHQPWLTEEQIDQLDRLSRERPVLAGRDQWRFALSPITGWDQRFGDDYGEKPLAASLPKGELKALEKGLFSFFDHLAPPEAASYAEYTWWVQTALLGLFPEDEENQDREDITLNLGGKAKLAEPGRRDREALSRLLSLMRDLMWSAEVIPEEDQVSWEQYRAELLTLIETARYELTPYHPGIRFAHLADGRARRARYLFLMGLSEGEFPAPPQPDVFYAPQEREAHSLPLWQPTPADDASLWWQVIGNFRDRLVLLRPYIDENGAPWEASGYWEAVQDCFQDLTVSRLPISSVPGPDQAASRKELMTALAAGRAQQVPEPLISLWNHAQEAERVIRQRESYLPPGVFEGVLQDEELQKEFQLRYGPDYVWSPSRLNRYAVCPYGFFAEYILALEEREEPEEGMDALQRGSLLHAILERFNREIAQNELALTEPDCPEVLELLRACCRAEFAAAPTRYGFRPEALWAYEKRELERMLETLVSWECAENGDRAVFSPYRLEVGFGVGSSPSPLQVQTEEGDFLIRGVIDRLDRDTHGNLRVIDYKSGRTQYWSSDMKAGTATQTALYALAAQEYWLRAGARVVESYYLHIPIREKSGRLRFSGRVEEDELTAEVITRAGFSVRGVREGVFPSAPAKPSRWGRSCREQCPYGSLCRVTRTSIAKARQGGWV